MGTNQRSTNMFLPEFNSTQLQRNAAEVFEAAQKEPILITRMGGDGAVMLSKKDYAALVKKAGK